MVKEDSAHLKNRITLQVVMENEGVSTNFENRKMRRQHRKPLQQISNCSSRSLPEMESKNPGYIGSLYPDQVLYAGKATLGEHQRKSMKAKTQCKIQREDISRAVCALLNSGGGIVMVESADEDYNYNRHGLGQDIEEILSKLLSTSSSGDYYDFFQHQSFLLIFVKTWSAWSTQKGSLKLCNLETGLYIRSFTSKLMANSMQVLDLAEKKKSKATLKRARYAPVTFLQSDQITQLLEKPYLCLDDNITFSESIHVEFKDFSTVNLEVRMKEIIDSYFSAFGNSDGGYLIIGVRDNGRITGCGKHSSKSELETCIKKAISNVNFVHFENCDSSAELYELTIKDVKDKDQEDSGYVIFLEVKPSCCLAFVDNPQCWILDPDGKKIKRLSASEWIKIMTKCPDPSLELQFERMEIGGMPPLAKPVYRKKGLESLEQLQYILFGSLEDKITIQPDKLYTDLKEEYPDLEGLLNTVVDGDGVIILSRSWAVDLELNSNPNVICDALLFISGKHPKLYSVVKGEISEKELVYSLGTALTLKKQLVNLGGYTRKLCVIPDVLQLNSGDQKPPISRPQITYPETYKLDDVKELLQSLLIVMLSFGAYLSNKIRTEYFNLLTTQQYEVLSRTFIKGPFFVHGPPGTGKTVVALKIIKKIKNTFNCSPEKILFICENSPLTNYVRDQELCWAVTRFTFERDEFPNVEHIVVDEAQNFQVENENVNWFKKAKQIVEGAERRGVFYIFLDYFQSCHKKNTGLPPLDQQNTHTLTKVVRSPEKIYDNMFKIMKKIASKNQSPLMKEIIENSDCCHGVKGKYAKHSKDTDEIVKHVAQNCRKYISEGHSQGDIAILCSTENEANQYKPLLEEELKKETKKLRPRLKPFERAENIMMDAIVLDSVRRFSGLERPIVFAINPVCLDSRINANVSLCAISRATSNAHLYCES